MNIKDRLFSHVKKEPNGCWNWTAHLGHNGYGMISVYRKNKRVHRLSYELHCGEIPEELLVLHKCNNRRCVNPDHLYIGTQQDNMDDMVEAGRGDKREGVLNPAAKLTEDDVLEIRWMKKKGVHNRIISEQYNINPRHVRRISSGHSWGHIGN